MKAVRKALIDLAKSSDGHYIEESSISFLALQKVSYLPALEILKELSEKGDPEIRDVLQRTEEYRKTVISD
ncbi:MAG: hypothetical protein R3F23_02820 [Verrucomicrobiia bacterium]